VTLDFCVIFATFRSELASRFEKILSSCRWTRPRRTQGSSHDLSDTG